MRHGGLYHLESGWRQLRRGHGHFAGAWRATRELKAPLVEQLGMGPLLPSPPLVHQGYRQPPEGALLEDMAGRYPRLGQSLLDQQHLLVPGGEKPALE